MGASCNRNRTRLGAAQRAACPLVAPLDGRFTRFRLPTSVATEEYGYKCMTQPPERGKAFALPLRDVREKRISSMNTREALYGPNVGYALELYERYLEDPASIDAATRAYFDTDWPERRGSAAIATPGSSVLSP